MYIAILELGDEWKVFMGVVWEPLPPWDTGDRVSPTLAGIRIMQGTC